MPIRTDSPQFVALITALSALGSLSTGIYLPSMPSIGRHFAVDADEVQVTLTTFLAGFALAQLALGPLSDRFGRRPVLLSGLAIYLVATFACALAPSIEFLTAARFAQAVGACAPQIIARAMIRDSFDRDRAARVMSIIGMAFALIPPLGPLVGGKLEVLFGWQSTFLAVGVLGAVLATIVVLRLGETNRQLDPSALIPVHMLRNYGTLVRDRIYIGYALSVAVTFGGLFAYLTGAPFVFISLLGVQPDHFGYLSLTNVIGYTAGALINNRIVARVGSPVMARAGMAFVASSGVAMIAAALLGWFSIAAIIGPFMLFMVGLALTMPNAMAGALSRHPRMAGASSALLGFLQMGFATGASYAVSHVHAPSQMPMVGVFTVMTLAGMVLPMLLVGRRG
jgi:DHA1 family bicyclomycin/chloramphenicol resistance-like MFS transporter